MNRVQEVVRPDPARTVDFKTRITGVDAGPIGMPTALESRSARSTSPQGQPRRIDPAGVLKSASGRTFSYAQPPQLAPGPASAETVLQTPAADAAAAGRLQGVPSHVQQMLDDAGLDIATLELVSDDRSYLAAELEKVPRPGPFPP